MPARRRNQPSGALQSVSSRARPQPRRHATAARAGIDSFCPSTPLPSNGDAAQEEQASEREGGEWVPPSLPQAREHAVAVEPRLVVDKNGVHARVPYPLSADSSLLGSLGVGIGLYFRGLWALGLLFLILILAVRFESRERRRQR